jgi:hypothetical protein
MADPQMSPPPPTTPPDDVQELLQALEAYVASGKDGSSPSDPATASNPATIAVPAPRMGMLTAGFTGGHALAIVLLCALVMYLVIHRLRRRGR